MRRSADQWGEGEGACIKALVPAYRSSPRLSDISQNSWLCYNCALLCSLRWIGSAFRRTKSLGMHTGAGSGNSNTALSLAIKEHNMSCPLWTGLVNTHVPIFCGETLPASHFTEEIFVFSMAWSYMCFSNDSSSDSVQIKYSSATFCAFWTRQLSLYIQVPTVLLINWLSFFTQ